MGGIDQKLGSSGRPDITGKENNFARSRLRMMATMYIPIHGEARLYYVK